MKYSKLVLLTICALFLNACEESFLGLENPNAITEDSFWNTEEDFQRGLVATYSALQYPAVGGANMSQYENVKSDVGRSFDFYNFAYIYHQLDWTPGWYVQWRWEQLYAGVFRANQVIENLEGFSATDDFTEEEKTVVMAQAKFLRAMFYFWIVNSFNQGIIHETVPKVAEDFNKELSSREDILNTIILPDLMFARENLPQSWNDDELGRATWGAATAALGKVNLYEEEWETSATYFKEIIDSGLYSLTADIGENFTSLNEFNEESIFEIAYNDNVREGIGSGAHDDIGTSLGAEVHNKGKQAAPQLRGGFRVCVPTHWVNELFEDDVPDPNNPINTDNQYSLRAYWSIAFLRQDDGPLGGQYYQQTGDLRLIADWFNGGAESAYWKKGTNWYNSSAEGQLSRSGINERIIRLADVYLMYAEAILMRDGDGALEEALTYVDMVRTRAGVITLNEYRNNNSGRIPQLHKRANPANSEGHPFISLSASSLMTHIQFVERVLELSFEGMAIRWNDLVRWGLVREAFQNQDEHVYTIDILNEDTGQLEPVDNGILEFCGTTCVEPEIFFLGRAISRYQSAQVQLERYDSDVHDYFPIPFNEINFNQGVD
ncbi:MAG: RagB/SusD family nutrient uptake outer membrane protein [Cyclobacteriaceae bacterium]